MGVVALLTHRMKGRARLRIAAKRRDAAWFEHARRTLLQCDGVQAVEINPATGSVLVRHTADFEKIVEWAGAHDLFEVRVPAAPATPASAQFAAGLSGVDARINSLSRGAVDGRALVFAGLLAAGAWQLLRGNVWPAAGSLVWYAFNALPGVRQARAGRGDSP
jgi:hypothetical protein